MRKKERGKEKDRKREKERDKPEVFESYYARSSGAARDFIVIS